MEKNMMNDIKGFITSITEIGVSLLALGIIINLISPAGAPFIGDVVGNITSLIGSLGDSGIVGLLAAGVILALFNK